ncbi:hypothetical protein [Marinomonas ostreistagni]|uniref:Recombination-associated protein RdgC n=1 Tax=Marinomonas ostreistagni TaxID=359209 RepID=A0ABS0ZCX1_9GAMM|nr:hypothetical protein [Marinomonas ostreistagni]MBJ7551524.1 hypothetical protein [Marinomonas ostreistagni]
MATCVSIKSVTLRYSPEEDRLLLRCQSDEGMYPTWWTLRLWQRAFPVLVQCLEKQVVTSSAAATEFYQNLAQQKADEVLMKETNRAQQEKTSSSGAEESLQATVDTQLSEPMLCAKVEFAFKKNSLTMMMFGVNETLRLDVQMSYQQLRQFLLAQTRCLQASEWPKEIPDWLLPEQNASSSVGASLH